MAIADYDYYLDVSAVTPVDPYTNADLTVYNGALAVVSGLPSGNALTNASGDSTNVVRVGYTAGEHLASAKVGIIRAYPGTESDSTVALTLGSSGAGYNFATSLGTETCYAARWLDSNLLLFRIVGGTVSNVGLTNVTQAPADGDEFVLEVVRGGASDTINIRVNGTVLLTYTDNSPITFSGNVASVSFKGLDNLRSSFYGFGVDGLDAAPTEQAGLLAKTLERNGVAVAASTASVRIFSGDVVTGTTVYSNAAEVVTSGVLAEIDLSATALAVGDPIVVAVLPDDGPGIVLETTVEDII